MREGGVEIRWEWEYLRLTAPQKWGQASDAELEAEVSRRDREYQRWSRRAVHKSQKAAVMQRSRAAIEGGVSAELVRSCSSDRYDCTSDVHMECTLHCDGILILSGPHGTGKTSAAVRWLLEHEGYSPFFARASELHSAGAYDREMRSRWTTSSAAVLDALGQEPHIDRPSNWWVFMLTELFETAQPLVVTTLMTRESLCQRYRDSTFHRRVHRARIYTTRKGKTT